MFGLKLKPCGLTNLVGTIVFGKLSAINRFVDSLPVAVCSGIANSFLPFRHGELITIFGARIKPTLDELSALWLSCSWICDALAVRQGDSSFSVPMLLGLMYPGSATMGQRPWFSYLGSAAQLTKHTPEWSGSEELICGSVTQIKDTTSSGTRLLEAGHICFNQYDVWLQLMNTWVSLISEFSPPQKLEYKQLLIVTHSLEDAPSGLARNFIRLLTWFNTRFNGERLSNLKWLQPLMVCQTPDAQSHIVSGSLSGLGSTCFATLGQAGSTKDLRPRSGQRGGSSNDLIQRSLVHSQLFTSATGISGLS
ncbi:hypothetical protein Tco_0169100 [Tanacetum coccineum]